MMKDLTERQGVLMERTEVAWRDRAEDFSPCGGCMVLRRN
jgi:hypothetical protein